MCIQGRKPPIYLFKTLISNLTKYPKKENSDLTYNYVKILTQILANRIHQHNERTNIPRPIGLIIRIPRSFKNRNYTSIIHSINKLKEKNHVIISIHAKKACDKITITNVLIN